MKNAGIVAIALVALVAATVGSAAGAAPKKVYYEKPYGQVAYKPKRIDFSDLTLTKIHWRHWNRKVAWGTGRGRENTCDPACAGGQIVHGKAHLKMYKRRTVHGRRMYTCLVGTVKAGGQKFPLEWPPACKSR